MIKDSSKISMIEYIIAKPLVDSFNYIIKLKKGFVFRLTNSNQIECDNIESINTVINFGTKWIGIKKGSDSNV